MRTAWPWSASSARPRGARESARGNTRRIACGFGAEPPLGGHRTLKIAATADVHARADDEARIAETFAHVRDEADVLVLAGDLTDHGRPGEAEALLRGLHDVGVPVVAVLGNHDHENGDPKGILRILGSAGIHILDRRRPTCVVEGVGFAGVKGFGGGFGDRLVRGFGEDSLKAFVAASVLEAEALRAGLLSLETETKFAVLHYAPVVGTIDTEPSELWPFLGTSRLEAALDGGRADVAVHGHAHHGRLRSATAGGTPVHNVSMPVLRAGGHERAYAVIELDAHQRHQGLVARQG
ncbi:MAG TPA: metallophosphoesterase [Candidatus Thermoplasmatota archaeon]|nr:metallophosphoesterase [Candidatus Thermoplasmatota archaeon]